MADNVDMAFDGIGLMALGAHTVNEFGDLVTPYSMTVRAAVTFYRSSQPEI